jgi:hypothetical protein
MINAENYITYVTGRSMAVRGGIRYVTVKILEEKKVFGLNRLDQNKNRSVYITEGPFDSLFLSNAVASADANLIGVGHYLRDLGYTDITLVYDNEPRNGAIVVQMKKAIDEHFKVVIHEHSVSKDINQLVIDGWNLIDVEEYIIYRTFYGHKASLEHMLWKRC